MVRDNFMKRILSIAASLLLTCNAMTAMSVSEVTDVTSKVDIAPVPIQLPPPEYPEALSKAGTSGIVVVTLVVDETCTVLASEIKKPTHAEFEALSF